MLCTSHLPTRMTKPTQAQPLRSVVRGGFLPISHSFIDGVHVMLVDIDCDGNDAALPVWASLARGGCPNVPHGGYLLW